MADIWKPQSKEVYQHWIDTIISEASDTLNNWESNFIHSVENYLHRNGTLTQLQAEKLESIYAEKTK